MRLNRLFTRGPVYILSTVLVVACGQVKQQQLEPGFQYSVNPGLPDAKEHLAGGEASVFANSRDAFSHRPAAVASDFKLDGAFTSGDHLFRTPIEGVGPLLNNNTCQGCHMNDGRGVVPQNHDEPFTSMLVKLADSQGNPDPVYGDQIQTFTAASFNGPDVTAGKAVYNGSVSGKLTGEATTLIEYEEITGEYPDGEVWSLRKPVYRFKDTSFGDFTPDIGFSVRVAPQIFGSGLLGAIPEEGITTLADPEDKNQDGVSGRVSWVKDVIDGQTKVGRFAYKAQNPTVLQQVAGAFRGDSGLTSSIFPQEPCTAEQTSCQKAADQEKRSGEQPDLDDRVLAFVEFYNRTLAVPANRGYNKDSKTWKGEVLAGRKQFLGIGCAGCHTPKHTTGIAKGSVLGTAGLLELTPDAPPVEVLSHQTIYPYTDLLLHDMGGTCTVTRELVSGESCTDGAHCQYVQRCNGLADGVKQGNASGSEWKTPALWGLGLVQTVNPDATFLHDGRARTIEEAILWHGGEAENSLTAFKNLAKTDREAILAFLNHL